MDMRYVCGYKCQAWVQAFRAWSGLSFYGAFFQARALMKNSYLGLGWTVSITSAGISTSREASNGVDGGHQIAKQI